MADYVGGGRWAEYAPPPPTPGVNEPASAAVGRQTTSTCRHVPLVGFGGLQPLCAARAPTCAYCHSQVSLYTCRLLPRFMCRCHKSTGSRGLRLRWGFGLGRLGVILAHVQNFGPYRIECILVLRRTPVVAWTLVVYPPPPEVLTRVCPTRPTRTQRETHRPDMNRLHTDGRVNMPRRQRRPLSPLRRRGSLGQPGRRTA